MLRLSMIEIPVSIGELFDKITILEIKKKHIHCQNKLQNVITELNILNEKAKTFDITPIISHITELGSINQSLWNLENIIRSLHDQNSLNDEYINTSIQIRKLNDQRASIKHKINIIMNSKIIEEKEHI